MHEGNMHEPTHFGTHAAGQLAKPLAVVRPSSFHVSLLNLLCLHVPRQVEGLFLLRSQRRNYRKSGSFLANSTLCMHVNMQVAGPPTLALGAQEKMPVEKSKVQWQVQKNLLS